MEDKKLQRDIEKSLKDAFIFKNHVIPSTSKADYQVLLLMDKERCIFDKKIRNLLLADVHINSLLK